LTKQKTRTAGKEKITEVQGSEALWVRGIGLHVSVNPKRRTDWEIGQNQRKDVKSLLARQGKEKKGQKRQTAGKNQ